VLAALPVLALPVLALPVLALPVLALPVLALPGLGGFDAGSGAVGAGCVPFAHATHASNASARNPDTNVHGIAVMITRSRQAQVVGCRYLPTKRAARFSTNAVAASR
jgi:hypothetical protein